MVSALLLAPLTSCAEPAHFNYYLLALSVAPVFCEDEPQRKRSFAQCRALSEAGFTAMPLTLHGLWPNRVDRKHPSYCGGETGGAFCCLPPLHLPAATRASLGQVMPAADCLDRYQWAKHGSCSGLAEADYFAAAVALAGRVNRAIGGEIARHMGREVDLATLREVRVYFERNPATGGPGAPLAYTRANVRHYNSGCPQGKAYVDTPLD